eukprot:7983999-Pyramimonas_sp.AAC.1
MNIWRRVDGVDAEFAAAGMEESLDVHGLGVGLDGHVRGCLVHLLHVVDELVQRVDRLGLAHHEEDVRDCGRSVEEDDHVPVSVDGLGGQRAGDVGRD